MMVKVVKNLFTTPSPTLMIPVPIPVVPVIVVVVVVRPTAKRAVPQVVTMVMVVMMGWFVYVSPAFMMIVSVSCWWSIDNGRVTG